MCFRGADLMCVIRMKGAALSISVSVVTVFMCSMCHHTQNQREIRSAADLQSTGSVGGSWGPWGPWQDCSRSCGGGLQKQSRVFLQSSGNPSHTHGWRKSNSAGIGPGRNPYITSVQTSDLRNTRAHEHRTHHGDDRSNTRQPSASIPSPGGSHRLKICNSMACPSRSRPIRELQCSVLNARSFMGRLYEWEPFSDGDGELGCQAHCRAVGFRFYIRQSDDVIDGSSCGQKRSSVCVAGQCERVGCDDVVGSEKIGDRCGVCGGDGRSCQLISGLFQHSLSKVGYHKIIDIPPGARNINITEMMKSTNYLALRSRSGGSIINGNWAIDRPGVFEGVGTMFTYRRPSEISSTGGESFLAEGPTNDILEVY